MNACYACNSLAIFDILMILIQGYFWKQIIIFLPQKGYNGNFFLNHIFG